MAEWLAFGQLEPFGPLAANLNAGMICSVIANVNRGKDTLAYKPKDFALGDFSENEEAQTLEEMREAVERIADSFKAKRVKRETIQIGRT